MPSRLSAALYNCKEFVKYEKLHLNVSFFFHSMVPGRRGGGGGAAVRALLLFPERDLAEMKPPTLLLRSSLQSSLFLPVTLLFCFAYYRR